MKKLIPLLLALLLVFPLTALAEGTGKDEAASLSVGDIVPLGHYEQDGVIQNGEEPIEWIVLDVDAAERKALVISKYSLDRLLYHSKYEPVTWETCDLRGVLNGEFLNIVFSSEEIDGILDSQLHTEDNTAKGTKGGNDTVDRVFLLSAEEAEKYFSSDEDRIGVPSVRFYQWTGEHLQCLLASDPRRYPGTCCLCIGRACQSGRLGRQCAQAAHPPRDVDFHGRRFLNRIDGFSQK